MTFVTRTVLSAIAPLLLCVPAPATLDVMRNRFDVPASEVIVTTDGSSASRRCGIAALVSHQVPNTFTSKVRDTETVSSWGRLRWEGQVPEGTRIEVAEDVVG